MMNTRAVTDSNLVQAEISGTLWQAGNYNFNINPDTSADLDGDAMSLEGGKYKITTGDARELYPYSAGKRRRYHRAYR